MDEHFPISSPDDLDFFHYQNAGRTLKVPAKIGRFLVGAVAPISKIDPKLKTTLEIPPNYVAFFYPSPLVSSSQYTLLLAGEYYEQNGAVPSVLPTGAEMKSVSADISSYLTTGMVEFQRYDDDTFVTNCIYSFTIPLPEPDPNLPDRSLVSNRGGVSKSMCDQLYNNGQLRELREDGSLVYPVTGIGAPPATPQPTPYTPPPIPDISVPSLWVWVIICVCVIGILVLVMIVGYLNLRRDPPPEVTVSKPVSDEMSQT